MTGSTVHAPMRLVLLVRCVTRLGTVKPVPIFQEVGRWLGTVRSAVLRAVTLTPEAANGTMKTLTMKFRGVLDYDPVTQSYSAVCPELPGCASAGETEAEADQNIAHAIRLYLAPTDIDLAEMRGW